MSRPRARRKRAPAALLAPAVLLTACASGPAPGPTNLPLGDPGRRDRELTLAPGTIVDARSGDRVDVDALAARLDGKRLVLFGETHAQPAVQAAERQLLDALARRGRRVLVGPGDAARHGTAGARSLGERGGDGGGPDPGVTLVPALGLSFWPLPGAVPVRPPAPDADDCPEHRARGDNPGAAGWPGQPAAGRSEQASRSRGPAERGPSPAVCRLHGRRRSRRWQSGGDGRQCSAPSARGTR